MKTFATQVQKITSITPSTKSIKLSVPDWPGHTPGQYVSVRIISPEGYVAERDYSIASAPDNHQIELVVELISGGEVSPTLHKLLPGDVLHIQGPRGMHFNSTDSAKPLLLISGGTGIVPFLSMLRYAKASDQMRHIDILASFRNVEDVVYQQELLDAGATIHISSTQGRITEEIITKHLGLAEDHDCLVSGSTLFVESIRSMLTKCRVNTENIKLERFG